MAHIFRIRGGGDTPGRTMVNLGLLRMASCQRIGLFLPNHIFASELWVRLYRWSPFLIVLAIGARRRIKLMLRFVIESYRYQNVHVAMALRSFRALLATFLGRVLLIFWIPLPPDYWLLRRLQFRSLSGLLFWLIFLFFVA